MKVLVTGGAGFIGSFICELLLKKGFHVIVLDNLDPQVHGPSAKWPSYMPVGTENHIGDIRNREIVRDLVSNSDAIIHLASAVGVGQSMYEIEHYCSVNILGTSILLEEIIRRKDKIRKLIIASSMSIYGEGAYISLDGSIVYPRQRDNELLKMKKWDLYDSNNCTLTPIPVKEVKPLYPDSIYAINKRDQEEMFLSIGKAYEIPTVAFRMFNVYGERQSLSNPYTGVVAIFINKLLQGEQPIIFEDGNQLRDFIHVTDVAEAYYQAIITDSFVNKSVNLGSGQRISVNEIALKLSSLLGLDINPKITNQYRPGDIRHCFADIKEICTYLDWKPKCTFSEGIPNLLSWIVRSSGSKTQNAYEELIKNGLLK
jgi:dTDP-L-rhamnose 4-epimerase